MKKLFQILFLSAILSVVCFSSCKESDDPAAKTESEILQEYLVSSGMDLDKVITSAAGNKFVAWPADADVSGKYVIDIRSADAYNAGHIEGAVHSSIGNILNEEANSNGKPILIACVTGQTACFATSLLRLYGYSEAQALKWGMSGWNVQTDAWSSKVGDSGAGKLSTDAAPENVVYGNPSLNTGETTGEAILKARVEAVVAEWGKATVTGADVVASPSNYFINNFFDAGHYTGFGHIEGAKRVKPLKVADGSVNFLDPTKTVVTYCYTGQTSAVITAYLRVLGYDAKSMLFGMNQLNHSNDFWTSENVANHWGVNSNPKGHPIVQ